MSDSVTVDTLHTGQDSSLPSALGVRILCHPDLKRIDDTAVLFDMRVHGEAHINRQEPAFRSRSGALAGPLGSLRVSRRSVSVRREDSGQVVLAADDDVDFVLVNEERLRGRVTLSHEQLERGVLLRFGKHVLMWFGFLAFAPDALGPHVLRGESKAMIDLRSEIARIADLSVSVLLRGESGSGKESVARAIHAAGPGPDRPFVAVNAATLHARGDLFDVFLERAGSQGASGGTLFIDELGAASSDMQAYLARFVDEGSAGSSRPVRLIAAVDDEGLSGTTAPRPRSTLLRRFGYQLFVPALRNRRGDVAALFVAFLEDEMRGLGEADRLQHAGDDAAAWIPAEFMARLVLQDWPGNLRELRNAARRFAVYNRGRTVSSVPSDLLNPGSQERPRAQEKRVVVSELKDEQIAEALERNAFVVDATAEDLGVSRSWLHTHLNESSAFRKAKDLTVPEIEAALAANEQDITKAALALRVSRRGLQLQMSRLGMRTPA